MRLRISARKSDLARLQAYQVGEALAAKFPKLEIQYNFRESLGDKNLTDPLWKMPEKGVFTEDFVQDLMNEQTDLVVHSWKDLPTAPREGTEIVATLPRADQRDLLLFKKSHVDKVKNEKVLRIFSSSPRRAYNLENFLRDHTPFNLNKVEFHNVRGNIQTRVRKMLEDAQVDGLIVAKAAIDRLLTANAEEFTETREFLRQALLQLNWMVLPLSVNPNAAAQGALAIEIKQGRSDLLPYLEAVNDSQTFASSQKERDTLASFGGGCHQKIGVAVLQREYGSVFFLKGLTDSGLVLDEKKILERKNTSKFTSEVMASSKELTATREKFLDYKIPAGTQALWIAKSDAIPENFSFNGVLWSAGIQTWKKLAEMGLWVHGSSEGLGEDEDPRVEILCGGFLRWAKLSHREAIVDSAKSLVATYQVAVSAANWHMGAREVFYWHSGSQFLAALSKEPGLRHKKHACGPGNTYKLLREKLGPEASIEIYLDENDWRNTCTR